jgi:hypothetical protein
MTLTWSPSRSRWTAERAAAKALTSRLPFIEPERSMTIARLSGAGARALRARSAETSTKR